MCSPNYIGKHSTLFEHRRRKLVMYGIGSFAVFVMVLSNLAISAVTPLYYLLGIQSVSIWERTFPLMSLGTYATIAYVGANLASAKFRPPGTWFVDFMFSLIAAWAINFTAYHHFEASHFANLDAFLKLPYDAHQLAFITVWSWVDMVWFQRKNWLEVGHTSATRGLRSFAAAVVFVLLTIFVVMFTGLDLKPLRQQVERVTGSGDCTAKKTFIGHIEGDRKLYRFLIECP